MSSSEEPPKAAGAETVKLRGRRGLAMALPWVCLTGLFAGLLVSWNSGGLVARIADSELSAAERTEVFRQAFYDAGPWSPILYVIFVCVEVVVAPIPGLMLYAPGGLIFGPWIGGILAIVGNVIGAGLSCGLTRALGSQWVEKMTDNDRLAKLHTVLEARGFWLIVMLRINPLTSTDLLSYAAGFTKISLWKVMMATGLGMAPLCFLQSWLSDSIFHRWPSLLWPLLLAGIVYAGVVALTLSRLLRSGSGPGSGEATE